MTTVSVVTGAAGAMGAACARAIAPAADVLLLTDVHDERLATAAEALERETPTKVCTVAGDLADPHFVTSLVTRTAELGSLGAVVHTAGLSPSMAGWREILQVDLVATARLLDAFLPHVAHGSAAVCFASVSGHMGGFDAVVDAVLDHALTADFETRFESAVGADPDPGATYRLAKRGVIRLCERAAVAWGARGGRVVSLSPGLIDTEMGRLELVHNPIKEWLASITPVGGDRAGNETILPGRIDDIARAVAFVCSGAAAFISGCDIRVDGGLAAAVSHQPAH
ncbi:MAG TPA: SDR family oxidoreductase [Acidimicrobiia bacterium]|jgi:NAD(P)-dependent dehydrogenase (short-subunit alcohol dehydrogenase family)